MTGQPRRAVMPPAAAGGGRKKYKEVGGTVFDIGGVGEKCLMVIVVVVMHEAGRRVRALPAVARTAARMGRNPVDPHSSLARASESIPRGRGGSALSKEWRCDTVAVATPANGRRPGCAGALRSAWLHDGGDARRARISYCGEAPPPGSPVAAGGGADDKTTATGPPRRAECWPGSGYAW